MENSTSGAFGLAGGLPFGGHAQFFPSASRATIGAAMLLMDVLGEDNGDDAIEMIDIQSKSHP